MKAILIKTKSQAHHKHKIYVENPNLGKNHRASKKASPTLEEYKTFLSISHKQQVYHSFFFLTQTLKNNRLLKYIMEAEFKKSPTLP